MTAGEILTTLTAHGVNFALIEGELQLDAPAEFDAPEWLTWFREAKAGIVAHLRRQSRFAELHASLNEADQYALDERAAVYEFDGGFTRDEADTMAAREWLASSPMI